MMKLMKEREILTRGPGRGMPRRARVRDLVSGALAWLARSAALAALLLTMPSAAQAQGTEQSETITTTCETQKIDGLTVQGKHFTIGTISMADNVGMVAYDGEGGITVTANDTEWITKVVITCGYGADKVTDESITVSPGTKTIGAGGTITVENVNDKKFNLKCTEEVFTPQFNKFVVYYLPAAPPTFSVSLKAGTDDAAKWTAKAGEGEAKALPLEGVAEGEKVTLQYEGRKRVMSVRATKKVVWDGDLSKLTGSEPEGFATATDGMTITGTLADGVNVKVMIAADATVTLSGATISGVNDEKYKWAGLTCLGNATIELSGTNKVKGFNEFYPGIYVPENNTLTISGDGSLDASSNGLGCGIGGLFGRKCGNITIEGGSITATGGQGSAGIGGATGASCGNITIEGGTVEATGGTNAAGIGSGSAGGGSCGNILITGGTVEAKGGDYAAGIGGGMDGSCLDITITSGVTKVTATKGGNYVPNSIGKGYGSKAKCGTVTIGCTLGTDGKPVAGTGKVGMVSTSPYIYPEPIDLSTLTADYTAKNGATLTGTLQGNVKISIDEGATVTLSGATIEGTSVNDAAYWHAGITCLGKATIVLVGTNTVKGFYEIYPGIHVPKGSTLTISGDGSLDASSNGWGCGIGGGNGIDCGNITIEGGSITATGGKSAAGIGGGAAASCGDILITSGTVVAEGGDYAAGIGSGFEGSCGDILITGGTVEAKGGDYAAGIGSGDDAKCGDILITGGTVEAKGGDDAAGIGGGINGSCLNITITSGVTKVTAKKGDYADYSIGKGQGSDAKCGTVTIGCTLGTDGKPVAGTGKVGMVETSPYIFTSLSKLTADYTAQDGETLTGTLQGNVKISIADGATVTLMDATIEGTSVNEDAYKHAGITCQGDATIVLVGTNKVKGFYKYYPGIHVPNHNTLTIRGDGSLDASSNGRGCGIGGSYGSDCGNITIEGGSITATGGEGAAGIGGGFNAECGDISITGGTVVATGGDNAAGIGSGLEGSCGKITITSGVTKVTATAGNYATFSIGKGEGSYAKCGTVTIGGKVYWNGSGYANGGDTYLTQSPLIYEP